METVKDFTWEKGMTVHEYVTRLGTVGFQSIELNNAANAIIKMKKAGAYTFSTEFCKLPKLETVIVE